MRLRAAGECGAGSDMYSRGAAGELRGRQRRVAKKDLSVHLVFFFVDLVFSVAYQKDKKKHLGSGLCGLRWIENDTKKGHLGSMSCTYDCSICFCACLFAFFGGGGSVLGPKLLASKEWVFLQAKKRKHWLKLFLWLKHV